MKESFMPRVLEPKPLLPAWKEAPRWIDGCLRVRLPEAEFVMSRHQDMEALWASIGEDAFGEDERMPYWAELWPASLLLTVWLLRHREDIAGRRCLDLGCGMGLSAMAGAATGARVVAVDYEEQATALAAANAAANATPVSLAVMDWRRPCLAEGRFEVIWGSDILYETRFYAPLVRLFRTLPAPGGRIWLSEPMRQVSRPVWGKLVADGFRVSRLHEEVVPFSTYQTTVALYEISL
jgi:predicted nicotinamide N-methyase